MHPSRVFFYACVAFAAGILAAEFFAFPDAPLLAVLGGGAAGAALFWKIPRRRAIAIACIAFVLGAARLADVERLWEAQRAAFLRVAETRPTSFSATIAARERLQNAAVYTLERVSLAPGAHWTVLWSGNEFTPGERVLISGARFDTATATESFLKRDGVAGSVAYPKEIVPLGNSCRTALFAGEKISCARYRVNTALAALKESFEDNLRLALPEPSAALAEGLLLGSRSGLPQNVRDDFKRTGLSHIVAVSGYNVSILILAVSTLLGYLLLGRAAAFWASAGFLLFFTLLAGASASVVRAALMAFLVILAQKESRMYSARVAIACAGALMLAQNPLLLRNDIGFWLSFLATAGLLTLYPALEERTHGWPKFGGVKNIILQSLAAQLFVLPVLIAAFGSVPLIFLASNAAVLPSIPPAMFFGFLAGVAGYLGDAFSRIAAIPAYALLRYELSAVEVFARFAYASVPVSTGLLRSVLAAATAAAAFLLTWRLRRGMQ